MSIQIVPLHQQHAISFRDLNLAWLEEYFYVEEKDKMLLSNPQASIIDKGGYIFLAEDHDTVVGCFSFIPFGENKYELGKMAVHQDFQGLKIGQQLLAFAIDFAKTKGWDAIILYSSTKLPTALHLYRKFGFKDVELEKDLPYARSDVKMVLQLKTASVEHI